MTWQQSRWNTVLCHLGKCTYNIKPCSLNVRSDCGLHARNIASASQHLRSMSCHRCWCTYNIAVHCSQHVHKCRSQARIAASASQHVHLVHQKLRRRLRWQQPEAGCRASLDCLLPQLLLALAVHACLAGQSGCWPQHQHLHLRKTSFPL